MKHLVLDINIYKLFKTDFLCHKLVTVFRKYLTLLYHRRRYISSGSRVSGLKCLCITTFLFYR